MWLSVYFCAANNDDRREKTFRDSSQLSGEGSAESMLTVERGLRELAVLKVVAICPFYEST